MEQKINDNEIIKSFNNQIAGHSHNNEPGTIGMVKLGEDCVLKPLTKPKLAHSEFKFYQEIWSSQSSIIGLLKQHVPKYYGLVTLKLDGNETTFLKLQDVSANLKKPCIADIKIGAQTWEPNVDKQKQLTEDMKYAATKKAYGIAVTGYQVFNLSTGELLRRDKHFGKTLTKESIKNALKEFFNLNSRGSSNIVRYVLQKLGEILSWWHQNKLVNIYGSSVLILYDAWELESMDRPTVRCEDLAEEKSSLTSSVAAMSPPLQLEQTPSNLTPPLDHGEDDGTTVVPPLNPLPTSVPWIRVCMIDFAHVVYPYFPKKDHNYINGLTNLIRLLENIII